MTRVSARIRCLFLLIAAVALLTGRNRSLGSPLPSSPQSYMARDPVADIFFLDSSRGWISKGYERTVLLRTDDGGESWRVINRDVGLSRLFFVDPNLGWGFRGVPSESEEVKIELVSTQDGGYSWRPLATIATAPGPVITDLFFLDERHGWFIGTQDYGRSLVFATNDGGSSVQEVPELSGRDYSTYGIFGDQASGHIWIVGEETIVHSGDRGLTWQSQFVRDSLPSRGAQIDLQAGLILPDGHGWTVGIRSGGIILSTEDYGRHWRVAFRDSEAHSFRSVSFWDEQHGCVVGGSSLLLCTSDRGVRWTPRLVLPRSSGERMNLNDVGDFNKLVTPGPRRWWVLGDVGFLFQTDDGGDTWVPADLPK